MRDLVFLKPSLIVVGVLNASRLEGTLRRHQLFLFELSLMPVLEMLVGQRVEGNAHTERQGHQLGRLGLGASG